MARAQDSGYSHTPTHLQSASSQQEIAEVLAERIVDYLHGLPMDSDKMSSVKLKAAVLDEGETVAKMTWTRAMKRLPLYTKLWEVEGRSVVRTPFVDL